MAEAEPPGPARACQQRGGEGERLGGEASRQSLGGHGDGEREPTTSPCGIVSIAARMGTLPRGPTQGPEYHRHVMPLPVGTVTFLFSDIEGSTRLEQAVGTDTYARIIERHDRLARSAIEACDGNLVKTEGDAVFAAFADAGRAVQAAADFQRAVSAEPWPAGSAVRVRMGLHTGEGRLRDRTAESEPEDYVGIDVNYAARVSAAANGGQVVISDALVGLVRGRLPDGLALHDEGPRRLKDFDEPRRLYRLTIDGVATDARPLRTLDALTNLPAQVTSFIGREREIQEVSDLLGTARLVTLTGPGGTGKTRLSLSVAERLTGELRDGAWFVELAPIRETGLVAGAIAAALALTEQADRPIDETLKDHLRDRELLLVLDNFEQIVAAAPLIADLLKGARGLRCLASSREILHLSGEQEYRVPPLVGNDAVGLFVSRARSVRPDFSLTDDNAAAIRDICARLDALPLAIELAAARIRVFTPDAILARLESSLDLLTSGPRDRTARQQTLRGAIAWSYELLDEDERALFRRLGPLVGGFSIEAGQAVADPDGELGIDIVDGLTSLVEKSLATEEPTDHGEPRFGQLATIRDYALECLDASDELAAAERRHAEFFMSLAELAGPHLMGSDVALWSDALGHDIHNLRAASAWALRVGEPLIGLRIAASIWRYFQQHSMLHEGRAWLDALLAHPAATGDTVERVRGLSAAGGLAYWTRDYAATRALYEERLTIAERLGGDELLADAHFDISFSFAVERDIDGLDRHASIAYELYERLGDEDRVSLARQARILARFFAGHFAEAARLEEENLEHWRRVGSPIRMRDSMVLMSAMLLRAGDLAGAYRRASEGYELMGAIDVPSLVVGALGVLAPVASAIGDHVTAARITGALDAIRAETGLSLPSVDVLHMDEPGAAALAALGAEPYESARAEGARMSPSETKALITSMAERIEEGGHVAAVSE